MDRLYRIGIRQYTVIVGAHEGAVAAYLNNNWMPDVRVDLLVKFSVHSLPKLLQNIAKQHKEPFIICGYNCFTHSNFPESLINQHTLHPESLVLSATSKSLAQSRQHYFAVINERRVEKISELQNREQYSLSLCDFAVFGQEAVDYLIRMDESKLDAGYEWHTLNIAQDFLNNGGRGYIAETAWTLQIEADRDLLTLNRLLLDEGQDAHILSEIPYTVQITPPVRIDPQVSIGQGAKIGPHVYLERGSSVGHNVVLRDAIILARVNIPAQKNASGTIITTRGPIS
ncbi:MAG: hypothetical protein OHK0046_06690 [Anaerolineae bacterium]